MVTSFRENDQQRTILQQYLPRMNQLLNSIAYSDPPAPENLLVSAISLVGDLLSVFGVLALPLMEQEGVNMIMARLRRSKQNKCKTAVSWVSREMQRVRRQASS